MGTEKYTENQKTILIKLSIKLWFVMTQKMTNQVKLMENNRKNYETFQYNRMKYRI